MNDPKVIEGYFLSFSSEEHEAISEAFKELGYDFTASGLREFILDAIEDMDEEEKPEAVDSLVEKISSIVNQNPEAIKAYANLAGNFIANKLKSKL